MHLWKWRRLRRSFRLTATGTAFLIVTLGVGFAALNTGNNLIYLVFGFLLSLLLLSGVLSDLVLWKISVARVFPHRMFRNVATSVEIEIRNHKTRFSSAALELRDTASAAETGTAFLLRVDPKQSERIAYRFKPTRRGRFVFPELRVSTRYPFGLIEKADRVTLIDEALVYPELLEGDQHFNHAVNEGEFTDSNKMGDGSNVSGSVRGYREGDRTRDIHWLRSATTQRIVVRERERDMRNHVVLRLNNECDKPLDQFAEWSQRFEQKVSEIAKLSADYLAHGTSVQILAINSSSPVVSGNANPDPIWRFLATLEVIHDVTGVHTAQRRLARR